MAKKVAVKGFKMPTRLEAKEAFIKGLAEYLAKDQAKWSIKLEMQSPDAVTWAKLRSLTPLQGYPTIEEAEHLLREFLG